MTHKQCPKCKQVKSLDEFYLNKKKNVYLSWCKTCGKARAVKSRQELRSSNDPKQLLMKRFYDFLSVSPRHKKKGIPLEFTLTINDLKNQYEKQGGKCYYTGVEMKIKRLEDPSRSLFSISLDRINSDIGYLPENIVFCCWGVNALKGTSTPEIMYQALKSFYETAKQNKKF